MIPLLPLLALAPQGLSPSGPPPWLAALLRDAPPSLVMPPPEPPRLRPGEERQLPPGGLLPGQFPDAPPTSPDAKPEPWKVLQQRASALIDRGEVEEAYRIEKAGHGEDDELFEVDRLPDAALLTGRYAEAQRLLVQAARIPGWGIINGWSLLSLASAAQGRVYPGQGAWALGELRNGLSYDLRKVPLAAGYQAPTAPADVAALSVLALGVVEREPAYLEWALRLDPRNEVAGTEMVDLYEFGHRPADAIRVAASMVKALPSGPARDRFAARLKALQAKPASAPKDS